MRGIYEKPFDNSQIYWHDSSTTRLMIRGCDHIFTSDDAEDELVYVSHPFDDGHYIYRYITSESQSQFTRSQDIGYSLLMSNDFAL